jgi:hypothetical protein
MVAPYSAPRVSLRLAPLSLSRYEKRFHEGLFMKKKIRRIKIKKLHRSGPRGDPGYIQPDWWSESASKVLVERTAHGAGNLGPVSSNVL